MIRTAAAAILPIVLLAGCAPQSHPSAPAAPVAEHMLQAPVAPPPAPVPGTVYIYRGMSADANTGHVDWDAANFGISGGTLSFGSVSDNTRPCWLKLEVNAPNLPVPVNGGGTIPVTLPQGVQQPASASPWPAVFDNNPAGHWSITRVTLGPSNSKAQANAALVFKYNADNFPAVASIVNGSLQNCQK
ncbi:hypothetical protein [Sphingomonas bacterium]|uniref:hypothetical protein n=1 Tax=Sphingomonas bacterium TaxID=1895847 RepID=UPI001576B916|nr:hypothetical protein [Sphingomonas bacterium]